MTFKSRKILLFFGVIWLLLGVVSLLPDMAFSEESVALTAEESQWIAGTPSITVGGEMDWAPFDFVGSDGTYQGLSRDVMDLVAQKTGLKLTYKTGQTWANLLKALEEGKLDVLPAIYHSEERAAFTIFTDPYFTVRDYVFMRDDAAPLTKIDDLANKKVAVIGGYVIIDRLQNQVPEMEFLEVNSLQEGVNAVLLGQADAYVDGYAVVSYHLAENMQTGLKPVLPIKGFNSPIRIGVSKQEPVLAGIVQKGLAAITSDEHRALRQKWFTSAHEQGANKQTGAKSTGQLKGTIDPKAIISRLSVSTKEQAWLNTKPTIRARVGQYPPYHFWDEEKGKGISADYLKHFCEGFGLNCVFFTGMPWVEAIDNIGAGKDVDLLLSIGGTRKLAGRVALTQTYLKPPRVIFTRKDGTFVREIDDLNGKTIAIERAYLMRELVSKNYPEIRQKLYPSTKTALEALSLGVVDAYIGLLPAASYIIDKEGYSNLKVAAPTPFGAHDHAMGVRKDWPELVSLLNSYFAVLLPEEKSAIRSKWLSVRYEYGIGLLDIVLWVGGVTLIALLIIGVIV
ncbi:MAG: transporter substrate-binding domain-containing protein, partial [Rhodospirillaceae bacterium]|nr:transporter substrate-binding domain-containing protein [Rhodospirillaceae bacterium]